MKKGNDTQAWRIVMFKKNALVPVMIIIGVLGSLGACAIHSSAGAQKTSAPNPQANLARGEGEVKKLLPLMEADNDGKVSKQEFMRFMEAEFDMLDTKREQKLEAIEPPRKNGFHK
jgi:hypothetical protein